jgi:tetratricopeptide (TPR) repeat protein
MTRYFCLHAATARGVSVSVLVLGTALGYAQVSDCGRHDEACLQAGYEAACSTRSTDAAATCEAWLTSLESREFSGELEWRLIAGAAYRTLAEMSAGTTAAADFVNASRARYLSVLDDVQTGPAASRAYLGLALVSDSPEEGVRYRRLAVDADPSNGMRAESLARSLYATGNVGEAGEFMEQAFDNQSDGRRWYQGAQAIGLHRAAGRFERAEDLQRRVLAESGIERIAEEAAAGFEDPATALAAISTACHDSLINLFGGEACIASIDAAAAAALAHRDPQQQRRLAEAVTSGTTSVLTSQRLLAEGKVFEGMYNPMFEAFLAQGIESPIVYVAYSHRQADRDRALELVERALALDPGDGELWLRLAITQLEVGRADDALESLAQARSLLSASRDVVIDLHMQRAEEMRGAER